MPIISASLSALSNRSKSCLARLPSKNTSQGSLQLAKRNLPNTFRSCPISPSLHHFDLSRQRLGYFGYVSLCEFVGIFITQFSNHPGALHVADREPSRIVLCGLEPGLHWVIVVKSPRCLYCPYGTRARFSAMDRITFNPNQCGGRPCIRGMRIRVEDVLDLLAAGVSEAEILADFPYPIGRIFAPAWPSQPRRRIIRSSLPRIGEDPDRRAASARAQVCTDPGRR